MNRSNIGNIITNASQIGAVSATTASKMFGRLGHAESFLNNLTEDEKNRYLSMRKEKTMAEVEDWERNKERISAGKEFRLQKQEEAQRQFEAKSDLKQHLSKEQLEGIGQAKAIREVEKYLETPEMEDVDAIMSNSPQGEDLGLSIIKNVDWVQQFTSLRDKRTGKFTSIKSILEETSEGEK